MNDVSRQRHWENVYATKGESEVSSGNARSLAGVDWTCGGQSETPPSSISAAGPVETGSRQENASN